MKIIGMSVGMKVHMFFLMVCNNAILALFLCKTSIKGNKKCLYKHGGIMEVEIEMNYFNLIFFVRNLKHSHLSDILISATLFLQ